MADVSLARREQLFPLERGRPPPRTFELGLVLGGTVGVGAYTAGALDALVEALHAWHANDPPHRVSIPFTAGASGGAVCATLLSLISTRRINHIHADQARLIADTADRGNQLFDVWVNRLDGGRLLDTDDIGAGAPKSVLNAGVLDATVRDIAQYARDPGVPTLDRPYFAKPYRWAITLANMRGIPYRLQVAAFEGFEGGMFVQHDDCARFAMPNGIDLATTPDAKREDEFWVVPGATPPGPGFATYETMGQYTLGSAAFPIGFPARNLERPIQHYQLRPLIYPTQERITFNDVKWPEPLTADVLEGGGTTYRFTTVDGGMFNVDPVSLVHRELAGLLGRNPRAPEEATRGLFMIDPLASMPRFLEPTNNQLSHVLKALVGAATGGARYLTADMQLLGDPNCFSRFQLVPYREIDGQRVIGEDALAGSALGAFCGFLCRPYRVHDFLLGRHNMLNYLRRVLTLRGDNKLFDGWSDDLRTNYACDSNGNRLPQDAVGERKGYYLPIIPVTADVDATARPAWPVGAFDLDALADPADTRIEKVLEAFVDSLSLPLLLKPLVALLVEHTASNRIVTAVLDALRAELRKKKLL